MSHIEFTRSAPDGQELFYQGWLPEAEAKAVVCLVHGLGEHAGRYAHVGTGAERCGLCGARALTSAGTARRPGKQGVTPPFDRMLDDMTRLARRSRERALPGKPLLPLRPQHGRQPRPQLCPPPQARPSPASSQPAPAFARRSSRPAAKVAAGQGAVPGGAKHGHAERPGTRGPVTRSRRGRSLLGRPAGPRQDVGPAGAGHPPARRVGDRACRRIPAHPAAARSRRVRPPHLRPSHGGIRQQSQARARRDAP